MKRVLTLLRLAWSVLGWAQRTAVREEVLSDWNKASGLDCVYDCSPKAQTPAPSGYKAFYISHYARHGSRYAYTEKTYSVPLEVLRSGADAGLLTPRGAALLTALEAFWAEHRWQVGDLTLAALGMTPKGNGGGARSGDLNLLARLISAEARGEPYEGQVAVGAVVLNRVEHPSFPNSIWGVIYQPGAFSCLDDGQFDEPVAESAYRAAQDALNGWDPCYGAIYYFNPATATSKWIWSRPLIVNIGKHRFCA